MVKAKSSYLHPSHHGKTPCGATIKDTLLPVFCDCSDYKEKPQSTCLVDIQSIWKWPTNANFYTHELDLVIQWVCLMENYATFSIQNKDDASNVTINFYSNCRPRFRPFCYTSENGERGVIESCRRGKIVFVAQPDSTYSLDKEEHSRLDLEWDEFERNHKRCLPPREVLTCNKYTTIQEGTHIDSVTSYRVFLIQLITDSIKRGRQIRNDMPANKTVDTFRCSEKECLFVVMIGASSEGSKQYVSAIHGHTCSSTELKFTSVFLHILSSIGKVNFELSTMMSAQLRPLHTTSVLASLRFAPYQTSPKNRPKVKQQSDLGIIEGKHVPSPTVRLPSLSQVLRETQDGAFSFADGATFDISFKAREKRYLSAINVHINEQRRGSTSSSSDC